MRYLILAALLALTFSCSQGHLFVTTRYLDHSYLASSHVGTPDPRQCAPFCGQELIIHWDLPPAYMACEKLHFLLFVRFGNATQEIVKIPIARSRGNYVYRLLNAAYRQRGGIATYKVEVRSDEWVLETWTHQVWTELIEIPICPKE